MKLNITISLLALLTLLTGTALPCAAQTTPQGDAPAAGAKETGKAESKSREKAKQATENAPRSVQEARGRARLLHETLHGALQVMHRDFFEEDERLNIPSRSLEDVFSELSRSYGVKLHWIAVDLKAMSVDNEPQSDFEKQAARVLKAGKSEFESVSNSEFQFAGKIRLSATCLTCHASRRSNNDDRAAGLVIIMPLNPPVLQKPK